MRARAIPVPRRVTTDQGKSLFLALAQKIRAHERGTCAFANSIGAEFGWGSALGRYIGHSGAMNPIIAMFLEELTCSSDVDRSDPEPTAAAQRMLTNEHARTGAIVNGWTRAGPSRRLQPMPLKTRDIVLAYLGERIELFRQAQNLFTDHLPPFRPPRNIRGVRQSPPEQRETAWQLKRLCRLRELLEEAWS